jgi:hypothetical protein
MNPNAVPAPPVHTHGTHQSGRRYWRLVARKNTPVQLFSALPGAFNLTSLSDSAGVAGCGSDGAASTYPGTAGNPCSSLSNFPRSSGRGLFSN